MVYDDHSDNFTLPEFRAKVRFVDIPRSYLSLGSFFFLFPGVIRFSLAAFPLYPVAESFSRGGLYSKESGAGGVLVCEKRWIARPFV